MYYTASIWFVLDGNMEPEAPCDFFSIEPEATCDFFSIESEATFIYYLRTRFNDRFRKFYQSASESRTTGPGTSAPAAYYRFSPADTTDSTVSVTADPAEIDLNQWSRTQIIYGPYIFPQNFVSQILTFLFIRWKLR